MDVSEADSRINSSFRTWREKTWSFLQRLNARASLRLDAGHLEDLTQNVLLLVLRKRGPLSLGTADGELPERKVAWLFRTCELELKNYVRREGRRRASKPLEEAAAEHPSAAPDPWAWAEREDLRAALLRLSADERSILATRHASAGTFEEVGKALGIPENTAKTRYHRALRHLRQILLSGGGRDVH